MDMNEQRGKRERCDTEHDGVADRQCGSGDGDGGVEKDDERVRNAVGEV